VYAATLKELLTYNADRRKETNHFLYDRIISILKERNMEDISRSFLIDQYNNLLAQDIYTEKKLVRKLISLNYPYGFSRYYTLIKEQSDQNRKGEFAFQRDEWQNFTCPQGLEILASTFMLCLSSPESHNLFGDHYQPIRISMETIPNICKANNEDTCKKALELLNSIDTKALKAKNIDLFYLNKLKDEIQEIRYSHKSKPYKIVHVLKILDDNRYLFVQ
jgi:hypothetical protein